MTAHTTPAAAADRLTAADMELLAFERGQWASRGRKDAAITERFLISPTRYLQRLNALLDRPAAAVYDPELVNRLRRLRDERRSRRGWTPTTTPAPTASSVEESR